MTRGCYLLLEGFSRNFSMARSNPAALRGVRLPVAPRLEAVTEDGYMDQYMETTSLYLSNHDNQLQEDAIPTPTPNTHYYNRVRQEDGGMAQGWSEATLTEVNSGRYSAWSTEGEYGRAATEKVGRMFNHINRALYEGSDSGYQQTDYECHEWANTFPHFQLQGEHLLDSFDDGTEMADPVERDDCSINDDDDDVENLDKDKQRDIGREGLVVVGRHIEPVTLSHTPEDIALKEEILAKHGVLEEYMVFDNSVENGGRGRRRKMSGFPSASHQLSPVTPEACLHHVVISQLMDVLWSEVVTILQPLVIAARNRALKVHSSRQSLQTSLNTSHSTSPHESLLLLPGLVGLPPHSAVGNSQYYHGKPSTGSLAAPALPRLPQPTALSGVMQIKPVSLLRKRMQSIMSPLPTTPPGVGSGINNRQVSGRMVTATRRPLQLRPIDHPALERIEQPQIRGYKMATNAAGGIGGIMSPPPTAGPVAGGGGGGGVSGGVFGGGYAIRNNQLPPLEVGGVVGVMQSTGLPSVLSERSPPVVRGKSTFSQRNSSAAISELHELRRLQLSGRPTDLRPSTSSRLESGRPLGGKKLSDTTSRGNVGSGMKIVGHSTGLTHTTSTTVGLDQIVSGRGMTSSFTVGSIAEDEEEGGIGENGRLNITGHSSGFIKSKPRSLTDARGKHRGHGR